MRPLKLTLSAFGPYASAFFGTTDNSPYDVFVTADSICPL